MKIFLYRYYTYISRSLTKIRLHLFVAADAILMHSGLLKSITPAEIKTDTIKETAELLEKREVEIREEDMSLKQAVVTTYFTQKQDPLRQLTRQEASIEYIAPWYNSINKLQLNGFIYYDDLPEAFIEQYQTAFVRFRKCKTGNYSIFEERWMIYYLFLKATSLESVFFTDISDVIVSRNPFELITAENKLFAGRDIANRIWHSGWMMREIKTYEKDIGIKFPRTFFYMPVYNAGVVGGKKNMLLLVIGNMITMMFKAKTDHHKDMTLLNYAIYKLLEPDLKASWFEPRKTIASKDKHARGKFIESGFPLNSMFKKFETGSAAYFIHK
jgi:hypothetical protein